MQCISIINVKFDKESILAINEIKKKQDLMMALTIIMPVGTMANIFLGNGALESTFNIMSTDFEKLAKAMASLPVIQKRVIGDIARREAIFHVGDESKFWRGIADGCNIY